VEQQYRGTALVTGASSGIGAATAAMLARQGWRVVGAARRADRLAQHIGTLGSGATAVTLDIADATSVDTLFKRLPDGWKTIDVLINCAGHDVGGRHRFDTGSMAEWARTIETNAIGTMRVTHAVVPGMLDRGRGHIVNIGSTSSVNAYAGGAAYVASKFALNGFTKAILADYRGKGVRVTHIMAGLTWTEFVESRLRGDKSRADEFYGAFPVTLEPDDIARAILYAIEQPPHVTIAEMLVIPAS